jgi:arsenite-transporting ATPase
VSSLAAAFDTLGNRRVVLFGGKGGVGKTTVASAAALHLAQTRDVVLFTTDPASNLADLFGQSPTANRQLILEAVDADALYARFLSTHLEPFLEIADRGTYLERDEMRRFFELALPGVDELMAWMRIGELAEERPEAMIVVDTAPTGHTVRMLSSSTHFEQLAHALDAMQEKHRGLVWQFTRREVRDAMDEFIDDFASRAAKRRDLLTSAATAFVPVMLPEPWVIEQTKRLIAEVREDGLEVPFVVLNRAREPIAFDERLVVAPRACMPLDSAERLGEWSRGGDFGFPISDFRAALGGLSGNRKSEIGNRVVHRLTFFAGKGGVGKTTLASATALRLARENPEQRYTILSVDPAHALRDVFAQEAPPENLAVEIIDTRAKWRRFRETLGDEIERAMESLTPRGVSVAYDTEAMKQLVAMAPPGADELFAITRLAKLAADGSQAAIVVDTAPTGHFLRLLDLPKTAGEWVREFMRLLLRYKELILPGSLGEELIQASRSLKQLDATLHSEETAVVVVTRPERIVVAETKRLLQALQARGIAVGGVVANYVTPAEGDECDQSMRAYELAALEELGEVRMVERRAVPPTALEEIAAL